MDKEPLGPLEEHTDDLLDHNYDGIQEYDNPIPGWWHIIFIGTTIFSLCYVVIWHMTPIVPPREERLAAKINAYEQAQFGTLRELPMDEDKIRLIMGNEQWLAAGESIYAGICTVCHADRGQGVDKLGFNLTDDRYVHVQELMDIVDMITQGSPNNAMPPQTQLGENEVAMVAAYVATLRGRDIEGPESANQGEVIPPFPEPITDVQALTGG